MRLDIDSGGYDTAAEALVGANRLVAGGYSTLTSKLGGFSAMGGDDKSSEDFVKNYDSAAAEVVAGIAELTTAFGTLGALTAASGSNHRRANAGSVYKKPQTGGGDDGIPGGEPETVSVYTPPSSLGADSQVLPEFWTLIVDHLQGYAWPSADVDRLRQAGSAWRDMGSNLDRAPSYVEVAKGQLSAQRSPEIALARTALGEVKGAATDLAAECRSLAESCDEYAEKVETTRETVIGLLKDLAIEIGATAVVVACSASSRSAALPWWAPVSPRPGPSPAPAGSSLRSRRSGPSARSGSWRARCPRPTPFAVCCASTGPRGLFSREQAAWRGEPPSLDVLGAVPQGAPCRARVRPRR